MNVSPKRQQGLTFISLVFILGLIAFFVLLGLKIGPIYLDHSKVVSALAEIEKTSHIEDQSVAQIRDSLSKVAIEYEVVKKIAGNLSVLVEFNDVIEVGQK
jgi:hypothetical protein